jgi:hypothetical protein
LCPFDKLRACFVPQCLCPFPGALAFKLFEKTKPMLK